MVTALLQTTLATQTINEAYVVDLLVRLQTQPLATPDSNDIARELEGLSIEAAPFLTKHLPKITDPRTFTLVGTKLRTLDYRPSIAVKVALLDNNFVDGSSRKNPVSQLLESWSYRATPALVRGYDSGNSTVRLRCAEIISWNAWNERGNPQVRRILFELADSPIQTERIIAADGLLPFALSITGDREGFLGQAYLNDKEGFQILCRLSVDPALGTKYILRLHYFVYARFHSHMSEYAAIPTTGFHRDAQINPSYQELISKIEDQSPEISMAATACIAHFRYHRNAVEKGITSQHQSTRDLCIEIIKLHRRSTYLVDFIPNLEPHLAHPDPDVRASVAQALGTTKRSNALPLLRQLQTDPNPKVKTATNQAIKEITSL